MTAMERVVNTLKGLPVDRPPVFAVLSAYGARLTGFDMKTHYTDPAVYVMGQQRLQEIFGFDLVMAPFDFGAIAEAFGSEIHWHADQAPTMRRPVADSLDKALSTPLPDPRKTGRLPFILESARRLSALYADTVPLFAAIPGPASLPVLMLGMDTWMELLLFDLEGAERMLDHTDAFFLSWAAALIETGVMALVVTEGIAAAEITNRELFETHLLPHVQKVFAQVKAPLIFHHAGGRIGHILDLIVTLPHLVGIAVGSRDDLTVARELIGDELLLLGNLDGLQFAHASADSIHAQAIHCFEKGNHRGRFALMNAGADIPLSTPVEVLHAFRKAADASVGASVPARSMSTLWLSCGVLGEELKQIMSEGRIRGELRFLDSMLHIEPKRLNEVMSDVLEHESRRPVVIVYGDCCPGMCHFEKTGCSVRTNAINCVQLLLGRKRYRELMRERAFMLLPEWTLRWREIFMNELGLNQTVAVDFMREHRSCLVYLDTGRMPVPREHLDACAAYTGLEWRVEPVGLEPLTSYLIEAETRLTGGSV
jgi:uroporphyrinogen decarboxylase